MPRPSLSLITAGAVLALLAADRTAHAQDTLWDLLRSGDPVRKSVQAAPPAPVLDPATGKPLAAAAAAEAARRRGGFMGFFDTVSHNLRRLGKALNSDIKVSGYKTMGFHSESISGSSESYQNDTYFGRRSLGGIYDNTDLTISGKLGGVINFETHYSNSLYGNPYDNRLSLNYQTRRLKIDAGDITGAIVGNTLIDFNRTLNGIQLSAEVMNGLRLTTLLSQTKAQTRTITLPGGNGPGPYFVYAGQIVDGTERVRVNDREMAKGVDYTLDPFTGELRFKPGTIIQELDTIAVTFETYGYNHTPGTLMGLRGDISLIKGARLGVTYLSQTSSQNRGGIKFKTDQFAGYDNPATPYTLDFPVEMVIVRDSTGKITSAAPKHPMTVTVGGVPQVYGTDYLVDPLLPNRVYFSRGIPSTQIVRITYVPLIDNDNPGDRSVMGLDAQIPLGKSGNLVAEFASSSMDLSGRGLGGSAWQLRGDMKLLGDKLRWNWNLRDIAPGFTSIESPGFRRNERGLTMGFDYQAARTLKLTANIENTKRPSYNYGATGLGGYAAAQGMDDFSQLNFGVNWQFGRGQLNYLHNGMTTRISSGGHSIFQTDNLSLGYDLRSLKLDLSLARNKNETAGYLAGTGTTTTPTLFGTDSLATRLILRWIANDRLAMTAVWAASQLNNSGRPGTTARDLQLTADITPLRNMKLTLGFLSQDSGGYSLLSSTGTGTDTSARTGAVPPPLFTRQSGFPTPGTGLYGGTGLGIGSLYGGGYNGGLGFGGNYSGGLLGGSYTGFGISSFGGRSRGLNLSLSYQPWPTLDLGFTWNKSSSEGDYQFNSDRNDVGLNVSYTLGENFALQTAMSRQQVRYLGAGGSTSSNLFFLNMRAKPLGRLVTNLSYQLMQTNSSVNLTGGTGTGTTTGTGFFGGSNLNSYGLRLEYPVWRGNNLFFQYDTAATTGYLASDQRTMMFGIDFDLTQSTKFTLGWRIQEHLMKGDTSTGLSAYSYRARSLDADIQMRF